ncbi:hypothetical protein H0G86_012603 [Trichoderma simmonsii]|uniref:Reverse transcriptase Ty1/copia-type domain-containing protein n=1 Tax=Trichoderma simmonsii TaxID=1491479 RepID=A0A8G0LQQ9_9HYPO|nr:hypothetical protein H0G86_012603 [Trichoderma simmonsii]
MSKAALDEAFESPIESRFTKAAQAEIDAVSAKIWKVPVRGKTKAVTTQIGVHLQIRSKQHLRALQGAACRGDLQESTTIQGTCAATPAALSLRVIGLAAIFNFELRQFDVINVFLSAEREEIPVTCAMPPRFLQEAKLVELERALYGIRGSPQWWFK